MPLTIVTGRANAGKTGRVYDHVRSLAVAGDLPVLLLPSGPDVARARRELAGVVPCGIAIAQFDRYLEALWASLGDGRRLVRPVQRSALARACALDSLGPATGTGAVALLEQLVVRAADEGARRDSGQRPAGVAGALLDAVDRYGASLERERLIEPGAATRILAALAPPPHAIAVNRFVDLTPAQEAVIVGWAANGANVLVALTWDPEVPATAAATPLVERLVAAGGRLEPATSGAGMSAPAELARLETELFAVGTPRATENAIALGLAQGQEAEALLVAKAVREALDDAVPAERIAVAYRDPERHVTWLRRALRDEGVTADIDARVAFSATPFGRALIHLWDAAPSASDPDASYAAFLRSGYSGVSPAEADEFVADLRAGRSRAARPAATRSVERLRDRLMRGTGTPASTQDWKNLADTLLAHGHPGDAPALDSDALADAAAHRMLLATAADLSRLEGLTLSADDVISAVRPLRVALAGPETLGRVQVAEVGRIRSRRFDVVIVGGLTADEFPKRGRADRLEGEAVGRACAWLGLAERGDEAAEERMAFYLVATRARKRLVLVRQEADDEGRATRESVFWDQVLDLYRDPTAEGGAVSLPPTERIRMAEASARVDRDACERTARGELADEGARALLSGPRVYSASELEVYASCPYRWFIERAVRPAVLDRRLDRLTAGTIAHEVLASVYRRLPDATGRSRVTPEDLAVALTLLEAALSERLSAGPAPDGLDEEQLLDEVRALTARSLERDATFLPGSAPAHVEWGFGGEPDDAETIGDASVSGRADRIDVGPDGLVVLDYKLGRSTPLAQFEERGLLQLQIYAIAASRRLDLPVAGGLYRGLRDVKDRGFYVQGLASPGLVRTDARAREEIAVLLEAAEAAVSSAADGIRAGRIDPRPEKVRCERCAWAAACRADAR